MTTQPPPNPQQKIYCLNCHYHLIGLDTNRCPECGQPFDPNDPGTFTTRANPPKTKSILIGISITIASVFAAIACLPQGLPNRVITGLPSIDPVLKTMGPVGQYIPFIFFIICAQGILFTFFRFIFITPRYFSIFLFLVGPLIALIVASFGLQDITARIFLLTCACAPISIIEMYWRQIEKQLVIHSILMLLSLMAYYFLYQSYWVLSIIINSS